MSDHRTVAMIALSLLIAAPALVLADVERSRDDALPRAGEYQLVSSAASTLEPTILQGMVSADQGWHDRWNGVDFPVRGREQFACADARCATSEVSSQR